MAASDWTFMTAHDYGCGHAIVPWAGGADNCDCRPTPRTRRRTPLTDDKPLAGQVAIVTGGVRRIGKATALALRARARPSSSMRAPRARRPTASPRRSGGRRARAGAARRCHRRGCGRPHGRGGGRGFGRVDILVNNAANRGEAPFLQMTFAQWRDITGVILDGAFLCSRAVLPHMVANKHGRIINIGGVSSHLGAGRRACRRRQGRPGRAHAGARGGVRDAGHHRQLRGARPHRRRALGDFGPRHHRPIRRSGTRACRRTWPT